MYLTLNKLLTYLLTNSVIYIKKIRRRIADLRNFNFWSRDVSRDQTYALRQKKTLMCIFRENFILF